MIIIIEYHGLRFNPIKTSCTVFGKYTMTPNPNWYLDNCMLNVTDSVTYLGVTLCSNLKSKLHIDEPIRKCQRAFFSLQSADMCKQGSCTEVKLHVWNTVLVPILVYGCEGINTHNTDNG